MREYEWQLEEYNRAGDGMGKVELFPMANNEASLLVLPLHELMFDTEKYMEYNMHERQQLMMHAMQRQNVHLKLHEIEELIEMLQSYVAWRKQNEIK